MSKVYIKKITSDKIKENVKELLAEIKYAPQKKNIFIKPNICGFFEANSPCIVNPCFVSGLIEYLKDSGIRNIAIGELPVWEDASKAFKKSGYEQACRKYGVNLLDLSQVERGEVELKDFKVTIPRLILDGEYEYINIAKFKTHILTQVSLCIKNQKGLLDQSGRIKMHINGDLHQNIKLLAQRIRPDFCMIEGANALEGNGPGILGREVKDFKVIIAGNNMEDVDWIGVQAMGLDPHSVRHLIPADSDIEIVGKRLDEIRKNFISANNNYHFQKYNIHFWITDKTCSGCSGITWQLKKALLKSPLSLLRFIYYALFKRIDILTGDVEIPRGYGKIICLGNCMERKSRKHNLALLRGCPPNFKDVTKIF